MGRTIAVANQKGGVAKTTTVHSLGAALAEQGQRVLLVDLDPQACLTYSLGIDPDALERVAARRAAAAAPRPPRCWSRWATSTCCRPPSTWPAPRCTCSPRPGASTCCAGALEAAADDYDIILIDCPPSLGILTINGLTAADEVLIPLQCETLSQRGVGQLLETIDDVRDYTNPDLKVRGVDRHHVRRPHQPGQPGGRRGPGRYGLEVLEPPVPKSVQGGRGPGPGQLDPRARPPLEGRPRPTGRWPA